MSENLISLPRWWDYFLPPGQWPEHDTYNKETNNHRHAPLDPLHSVELLLQDGPPARLSIICTTGDACLDIVALRVRYLWRCICETANSNNILLKQPDDEDTLSMSVDEVQKGSKSGWSKALTRLWLLARRQSAAFSGFTFLLPRLSLLTQW